MQRSEHTLQDFLHARTIPITANLVALIFVSLSDLRAVVFVAPPCQRLREPESQGCEHHHSAI